MPIKFGALCQGAGICSFPWKGLAGSIFLLTPSLSLAGLMLSEVSCDTLLVPSQHRLPCSSVVLQTLLTQPTLLDGHPSKSTLPTTSHDQPQQNLYPCRTPAVGMEEPVPPTSRRVVVDRAEPPRKLLRFRPPHECPHS